MNIPKSKPFLLYECAESFECPIERIHNELNERRESRICGKIFPTLLNDNGDALRQGFGDIFRDCQETRKNLFPRRSFPHIS